MGVNHLRTVKGKDVTLLSAMCEYKLELICGSGKLKHANTAGHFK